MSEEKHNPYTPTQAPLIAEAQARSLPVDESEREYGGFWIRVGALLIDGLILLPLSLLNAFGLLLSQNFYLYSLVPMMVVNAVYWMYLVKRFGGTPGKRLVKLRITMANGEAVTTAAAIIRNLPLFAYSVAASVSSLLAVQKMSATDFQALGLLEKMQTMRTLAPAWGIWIGIAIWIWMLAGIIVLLSNRRRRAVHDFLAGTVVIRE